MMVEQETSVEIPVPAGNYLSTPLFVHTPPRRKPLPALAGSVALHGMLLAIMLMWPAGEGNGNTASAKQKYPVRFLQLQMPRAYRKRVPPGTSQAGSAGARQFAGLHVPAGRRQEYSTASNTRQTAADAAPALIEEHRRFRLPSSARAQAVKQTLVQLDVPPNVVVKHEIPLPAVLLWTQTEPPPMKKQFIAPPVKAIPKIAQKLPLPAAFVPPNREINIAPTQIAASMLNTAPSVMPPPAVASPASAGQELAKELPKVGVADSNQPSAANIISLPDNPLRSTTMIALPPANQVASSGGAKAQSQLGEGGVGGSKEQALASRGQGQGAPGEGGLVTQNGGSGGGKSGPLAEGGLVAGSAGPGGGGSGSATALAGNGGNGSASSGSGAGTSIGDVGNGSGEGSVTGLAGFTRLTLPKDGKFGVVVQGYAGSVPYPESVGALSGKVVYTVYLKVGLKRSWILQYCLPKANETSVARSRSATRLDAPWPYLVMRPDGWGASDPDYVMIHGTLTSAGRFDQMAMAFPDEFEKKDLLLKSLKLWAFRPASRDGEPVAVEVLLIIPRQPD